MEGGPTFFEIRAFSQQIDFHFDQVWVFDKDFSV